MSTVATIRNTTNDIGNEDDTLSQTSQELKQKVERNKQKALLLKSSKLVPHPYAKGGNDQSVKGRAIKVRGQRVIDTGGGFLIEEDDDIEKEMVNIVIPPVPIVGELPHCDECKKEFRFSYLLQTFNLNVCDTCRDSKDKHSLITKSQAMQDYLLKECDLDKREPALKYILRTNPHDPRWGKMKLYLHLQIEQRALEVWGSEEKLIEEKERRQVRQEEARKKKFNKKWTMRMKSSRYANVTKASHVHEFGEDHYNEDDDTYTHTCLTCGYDETYEKM